MALIKCMECGKKVSDRATICPNCDCPISQKINNKVMIKMNGKALVKIYIFILSNGKVLWEGYNGEIAKFEINKEEEIAIGSSMALKHPYSKSVSTIFTIESGKKYEYKLIKHFITTEYVLNEVEIIDSGL